MQTWAICSRKYSPYQISGIGYMVHAVLNLPARVKIVEVGPRDGLQNEATILDVPVKVELVNRLSESGIGFIEVGAFVSPKKIPQMANSSAVFQGIQRKANICYSALVPNTVGFEAALASKVNEIAVFAAASETFSQRNINCSIDESFDRFLPVITAAKHANIPVRGYLSCVLGCPYEGKVEAEKVAILASRLFNMGCHEVSLGDTIGVGVATETVLLIDTVSKHVPIGKLAVHFHDTYGQALANIITALQKGISIVDSSVAGLGGCPYAVGASGNIATEDVVYALNKMGIKTDVDLEKLSRAGMWISQICKKNYQSKAGQAFLAKIKK